MLSDRLRYHITRGGVLFAVALFLTGLGAFLSGNNLIYLIFSAMLALLLVSGFLSRLVLSGLELELLLPEHVSARAASPARIRVRNLKRLTPSFSIELSGSILAQNVYFPLIPGRVVTEAAINVIFPRRGRHRENLFVLSTSFPFGFIRKTATVTLRRETIVYPSLEPGPGMEPVLEDIAGEIEVQARGNGLDFYRVRPYETTDSARLVDWKSTAHTGSLQVREFSRERRRGVEIFLDRQVPPERTAWFEEAVERCAFLVWELTQRDVEVCLSSQRFSFAVPDDGEVYALLRYLALVEFIPGAGKQGNGDRDADRDEAESPQDPAAVSVAFSAQPRRFEDAGWTFTP